MHRRRGFSLALVLLVSSVVLTIGLALGVMCSINLHRATEMLASRQSELLSRAAASELMFELDQRVWNASAWGVEFPDMSYGADGLKKRYDQLPTFPNGGLLSDQDAAVSITFDSSKPYYSVDNLMGSFTIPGWSDRLTSYSSVPPFSVDLVVTTNIEGNERHRDVVLSRQWPVAAYCVLSAVKIGSGCNLMGTVYDQNSAVEVRGTGAFPCLLDGDIWVAGDASSSSISISGASTVTGSVRYSVPPSVGATTDALGLTSFPLALPVSYGGGMVNLPDDPDTIAEIIHPAPQQMWNTVLINDLSNFMNEYTRYKRTGEPMRGTWSENPEQLEALMRTIDRARYSCMHMEETGLEVIYQHLAPNSRMKARSNAEYFLLADVNLANGVFSSKACTTRVIVSTLEGVQQDVITASPTMNLESAMLIVSGDLDVERISGSDATLYVYGDLFLHGGELSGGTVSGSVNCSRMLIWADSVIVEELGGDFKGLITARRAMYLSPTQNRLVLRGALLSGGARLDDDIVGAYGNTLFSAGDDVPLTLNNTKLIHDPSYTKELNRFGTTRIRRLYEIP